MEKASHFPFMFSYNRWEDDYLITIVVIGKAALRDMAFLRRFYQTCLFRREVYHLVLPSLDFTTFLGGGGRARSSALRPIPQPGGPGLYIYVPQWQGGLVIPPGTRFPFRLLRLVGRPWRYSNPPLHWTRLFNCYCKLHVDWLKW
jgi:hypothetical protein